MHYFSYLKDWKKKWPFLGICSLFDM